MTQRRVYQNEYPYFVTANVKNRGWLFKDDQYAFLLDKVIIEACKIKSFFLFAFCILPDHFHLLVKKCDIAGRDTRAVNPLFNTDIADRDTRAVNPPLNPMRVSVPALKRKSDNISDLLYTIKSFFSYEMRKKYGVNFKFWQSRYNFRIINNEKRLYNTIQYIKYNYQKHGLSEKYSRYPYLYVNEKQINALFF